MDFEDMMRELSDNMQDDELEGLESELRVAIPPLVVMLGVVYDEMILAGFSDSQSFQFASDYIFELMANEL